MELILTEENATSLNVEYFVNEEDGERAKSEGLKFSKPRLPDVVAIVKTRAEFNCPIIARVRVGRWSSRSKTTMWRKIS